MQRFDVPLLAHVYEQAVSLTTEQLPRCLAVTCGVLCWLYYIYIFIHHQMVATHTIKNTGK